MSIHVRFFLKGRSRPVSKRAPCAALFVLISAQFVIMLDTPVVNVALPSMQQDRASTGGRCVGCQAYFLALVGFCWSPDERLRSLA